MITEGNYVSCVAFVDKLCLETSVMTNSEVQSSVRHSRIILIRQEVMNYKFIDPMKQLNCHSY